ncbi:hypothetical protein Y88_2593 [Novosphingobium nitrogenifigens DSM 19370]|uniref:Uncharacterized protein n=1 Tax=Novosphingobium nitrogenifigens DSM 19370 TaxID=983920 RepID=F1Z743_9SPHN|nr:hypothetical protein Y88_2593 [Novosphingobium nitrogenifigens DSM 19370]
MAEATLAALIAGDRSALDRDPTFAAMQQVIRDEPALGDFGTYQGVAEIGLGWETFAPTPGANPTLGTPGETSVSPTVTLTTWINDLAAPEQIEAALAALLAAHPWEVPVIEMTETRMLVRPIP